MGALLPYHPKLPSSACSGSGVDAVIQSYHKTVGSLTQCATLHLPKGSKLKPDEIQQALNHLQTTSPNYGLLASLEWAHYWLTTKEGQQRLTKTLEYAESARQTLKSIPGLSLLEGNDPLRFYIRLLNWDGDSLAEHLETHYGLSYESNTPYGVLFQATLGLEEEAYQALISALQELSHQNALSSGPLQRLTPIPCPQWTLPEQVLSPREAFFTPGETIAKDQALGRISKTTVVHCPPGIPELMSGGENSILSY